MNESSRGGGSQGDKLDDLANLTKLEEYTLPLNPAKVRSVLMLFDKGDRYTDEAATLNTSVLTALTPVVEEALQKGFSIREIIHVLHLAVTDIELDVILDIPLLSTGQTQIET